jgi:PIN domain nuclease of toxin-antitoxin system
MPQKKDLVLADLTHAYLLDTHAWVWIMEGKKEIKDASLLRKLEAASEASRIFVAAVSLWEVSMLEAKGRIGFRIPCLQWLLNAVNSPGLSLIPIDPDIAFDSANLPEDFHGDPADRLIVATARKTNSVLVTRDSNILDYAAGQHLKAVKI